MWQSKNLFLQLYLTRKITYVFLIHVWLYVSIFLAKFESLAWFISVHMDNTEQGTTYN